MIYEKFQNYKATEAINSALGMHVYLFKNNQSVYMYKDYLCILIPLSLN